MIDLNCYSFCENIVFTDELNQPLVADANQQEWLIKTQFNGRLKPFVKEFQLGNEIAFAASELPNESAVLYVSLYKEDVFVNKYKIKIYPQI